uniref:Uncharacterized protein n=1 Tax=Amphimedon queenslandica TaxID=400682 RepID=A0A1X7UT49_AMPQE
MEILTESLDDVAKQVVQTASSVPVLWWRKQQRRTFWLGVLHNSEHEFEFKQRE